MRRENEDRLFVTKRDMLKKSDAENGNVSGPTRSVKRTGTGLQWMNGFTDGRVLGAPLVWLRGNAIIEDGRIRIEPTGAYLPQEHDWVLLLAMANLGRRLRDIKNEGRAHDGIKIFVKRFGLLKFGNPDKLEIARLGSESVETWRVSLGQLYSALHLYTLLRAATLKEHEAERILITKLAMWQSQRGISSLNVGDIAPSALASLLLSEWLNEALKITTVQIVSDQIFEELGIKKKADPRQFSIGIRADNLLLMAYRTLAYATVESAPLRSCVICGKVYEGRSDKTTCGVACRKKLSRRIK
jgi:hypothetical protein